MNTSILDPRKTVSFEPASVAEHPVTPEPKVRPPLTFRGASAPWRMLIQVGTEPVVPVRMELSSDMVVGRADSADGYTPSLDLSPYGGRDAGVSRRHAMIFAAGDSLFIRDLASTNGTTLNGLRLKPNQTYPLKQGDNLEIGHLQVVLKIINAPVSQ